MHDNNGGRYATEISDGQVASFNHCFGVVCFPERGTVRIIDLLTRERLSYSEFKRRYGVFGSLWLASPNRLVFPDLTACVRHIRRSGPKVDLKPLLPRHRYLRKALTTNGEEVLSE